MKKENCKTSNRACRLSDRRFFTVDVHGAKRRIYARTSKTVSPVRSRSIDKRHCRVSLDRVSFKNPSPPPPLSAIDLRSNREKHEIPSFLARFTKSDSSSRKEFQLYELDLHIGRTERLLLASRPEKVRKRAETVSFLSLTRVLDTRR